MQTLWDMHFTHYRPKFLCVMAKLKPNCKTCHDLNPAFFHNLKEQIIVAADTVEGPQEKTVI